MTIAQAGAVEQDSRTAASRDRAAQEVVAIVAAELDKVDLSDPAQAEFAHIERAVQSLLRRVGGVFCGRWAQNAAEVLALRPTCPACPKVMAIGHRAAVTKVGLVGECRLERIEYVCTSCGEHRAPAEEVWKLGPGELSPELSRVAAAAAVEIPSFARAARTVGEVLGIPLSTSTVERTAEAMGAVAEADMQAQVAEVLGRQIHSDWSAVA